MSKHTASQTLRAIRNSTELTSEQADAPMTDRPLMFSETELGPLMVPRRGHMATPGSGPPGKCCRGCVHYSVVKWQASTSRKCGLARDWWTHGAAADIRAGDPACHYWTRTTGVSIDFGDPLPTIALSIRQPWAWAILNAGKDIENRGWSALNPGLKFRGRIAIHAAQGMTRDEYEEAREWMDASAYTVPCPDASALIRGAICGAVDVVDVVRDSDSRWFFGPVGLVLANPVVCPPIPCKGQLGYFTWSPLVPAVFPPTPPWMLPKPPRQPKAAAFEPATLFDKER
jgi:hypothetical protein